uniref:Putative interferon-inducible protein n=1 Tax=Cynoglossus semilaevis TaxID=244447 RepID=A0A0D3MJA7_CYNSE|nr:putative interferon-inducible protein [Cynoglossus semilaevis]
MSAAETKTLKAKLEDLQCHFTWNLDATASKLLRISEHLIDIGSDEGNTWLGQIYNLLGYIHFKLGNNDEAGEFFTKSEEALLKTKQGDQGPWMAVNYANQAWLRHHQGEEEEAQVYLSKIDALMKEYPTPSQDELHPEIYGEKAWTLLKFGKTQKVLALDLFKKAIEIKPDVVEWQSSYFIGFTNTHKHSREGLPAAKMEEIREAMEQDPENLYLAAVYLKARAERGEHVEEEARELATKILGNPVSCYSGLKVILRVYRTYDLIDEAIALAEEALENHAEERYLKRCAALCYQWKLKFSRNGRPTQRMIERAMALHKDVIVLYPHSSFVKKMDLATVYAKTGDVRRAEEIYKDLLRGDLEPEDRQVLYNSYAKFLNFERNDRDRSVDYHMMAAEIHHESFFRQNSISALEKIRDRGRNRRGREIAEFLENLEQEG